MKAPMHPYAVAALAFILPGMGQVANGQPRRGLVFLFFMLLLGAITAKTAAPDVSVIGRYAGGLFIYALSLFDAYRLARLRYEIARRGQA
ncbi:hypothetical protein [Paragemmobacter straminiformis]|uniref:Uncharacterized protein n=1 Tax=Paragemmobacter straminiformis TaxID=2045119 RepID=A0A842I8I9_9RHOB|nr:hypothetical protein [Gemmobacter straminiformis]MBC2835677.1 hypothetical protein [Gemmobacter straminiformis]